MKNSALGHQPIQLPDFLHASPSICPLCSRLATCAFPFVLLFLVFSSLNVQGQITTLSDWSNVYHNTATTTQNVTYSIPTGSNTNRLLVVAIASSRTTNGARTVVLSYGGQSLIQVAGDLTATGIRQHTALYYLNESGIDAATNTTLSFQVSGGTTYITDVFVAAFDGVNQNNPINASQNHSSTTTQTTFQYGTALNISANSLAIEVVCSHRTGSNTLRTVSSYPTNWSLSTQQTQTGTDGTTNNAVRNMIITRTIPSSGTTDNASITMSGTSLPSMTAMNINAALNISGLTVASASAHCTSDDGASFTISSSNLASDTYTVTYNVTGTSNSISSTTANVAFTAGSPGTGILTTSKLNFAESDVLNITRIANSGGTYADLSSSTNFTVGACLCAYSHSRTITVNASQVSGGATLKNYPLLVSFTNPQLATVANGGNVRNVNGYDVRFMLKDSKVWLDHDIQSYNPATGAYSARVRLPSYSNTANTSVEVYYGNAAITTNPSSSARVNSASAGDQTAGWTTTNSNNTSNPSLFISVGAQKQADCTGPGGVGTMDGTSPLALWLKANGGVESSTYRALDHNQSVAIWRDQSGSGKDATEATNQPDYQTNQVQGQPALLYVAANADRLLAPAISDSNQFMIFIVAKINTLPTAPANIGLVHAQPSGSNFNHDGATKTIGMWVSPTGIFWGRVIQSNGTIVNYTQSATAETGTYYIMTNYANGSNTTGQYIRGIATSASQTYNGTVQSWVDFGIGRQGAESWDGHIAEVIVFKKHLGESDRAAVENYLASKYGAAIPRLTGSTGPGSIGERDGSSRLELWYDALDLDGDGNAEGALESGQTAGTISTWADKSGNGVNLATGSATYTTSNSGMSDQPTVDFNGTSQYLQTANVSLASANALEYFIAFRDGGFGAGANRALINWETTGNVGGFSVEGSATAGQMVNRHYVPNAYTNVNTTGFSNITAYIYNGSYGTAGRNHLRDGTSIASNGTAISLNDPSAPFAIGRNISTTTAYFQAEVAEFISYSVELNACEKEIVEQYLSEKYGIAISGTDYYVGNGYKYGVQGIGTSDGTLANSHTEARASRGLDIYSVNGSLNAANEYVFVGYKDLTDGVSTSDLSGTSGVQRFRRVWRLDVTGTVDVKMTFNVEKATGSTNFPAGNGYVLLYSASDPYSFVDWTTTYGITPTVSNELISFTVTSSRLADGYYTVATTDEVNNPLPVELVYFHANVCGEKVCMEWETATELNNDYFEIERSPNGKVWHPIARITGNGTTDEPITYNYVDENPIYGVSFYRLNQYDYDGTHALHETVRLSLDYPEMISIYPNPTTGNLIVSGYSIAMYDIQVLDISGRLMNVEQEEISDNKVRLLMTHLAEGIYLINIETEEGTEVKKIFYSPE